MQVEILGGYRLLYSLMGFTNGLHLCSGVLALLPDLGSKARRRSDSAN